MNTAMQEEKDSHNCNMCHSSRIFCWFPFLLLCVFAYILFLTVTSIYMREINSSPRALGTGDHRSFGLQWELSRHKHVYFLYHVVFLIHSEELRSWQMYPSEAALAGPAYLLFPCVQTSYSHSFFTFSHSLSSNFSCFIQVVFPSVL